MKSTGIVRRIDELGRIVLPIEIRKNLNLGSRDAVEIFVNEDTIVLKKYEPAMLIEDMEDSIYSSDFRDIFELLQYLSDSAKNKREKE